MTLINHLKSIGKEFDGNFPPFEGSGAPFPIFKETPNNNHVKSHLIASQLKTLELLGRDIEEKIGEPNPDDAIADFINQIVREVLFLISEAKEALKSK